MNAEAPVPSVLDPQAEVRDRGRQASLADAGGLAAALPGTGSFMLDFAPYLGEAAMILMGSYVRSMHGLADNAMRRQPALMAAWAAWPGGWPGSLRDRGVLVEDLRAFLRETGDAALLEARRLELELAVVREKLARTAAPAVPDAPYRRVWTPKP